MKHVKLFEEYNSLGSYSEAFKQAKTMTTQQLFSILIDKDGEDPDMIQSKDAMRAMIESLLDRTDMTQSQLTKVKEFIDRLLDDGNEEDANVVAGFKRKFDLLRNKAGYSET